MFPVTNVIGDWNERTAKMCGSNNWRASLVPAAAVIPAPRVYTKAVAVKKLVVNFYNGGKMEIIYYFHFLAYNHILCDCYLDYL